MADEQKRPAVEYLARHGEGAMNDTEFRSVVNQALSESVSFVDGELSPDRATASKYYQGAPFGNEEEGRSQVVLTEVRDAVDGMLPSLLRVFFGAEHAVEFVPTRADNVEQAKQKTDYVRYVFEEDNAGFLQTHAVLKDGLIRKIGIFKWGWDDDADTRNYKLEGVEKSQLDALAADEDVAFSKGNIVPRKDGRYDVELTKTTRGGRAWVKAVPPEEFVFNRQARDLDSALVLAHRTELTRGQLIAMGVDEDLIDRYGSNADGDASLRANAEELARKSVQQLPGNATGYGNDPPMGKANDKILYTEGLWRIDFDGDGKAEQRRVCTIGAGYYPVKNVPADESMGFAVFTPYPEPHTLIGGSVADRTMDLQKINSSVFRAILDSAAASIFPRTVYVEGQASVADIMNTAIGAPIRERVAGAVRPLVTPFVGKEMMPVLGFTQEVIERRTGRNKGAAGLDADALQSTGKEAVGAVLTGSQEQLEMLARVFAEMTLKPLMRGLGKLLQAKQPRARMVRLRGQWVDVDPRVWDDAMDVTVNVGLGSTFTEKKVATLLAVAADQKELLMTMGLMNPLVTLSQFRNTRAKILELQGLKDVDNYYQPVDPNWHPPAPPAPPPDPEQLWIQAEKEMNHTKTMKELAIKADEQAFKHQELEWEREFKLRELETQTALKRYEIEATTHVERTEGDLNREIERETIEAELTMAAHDQLHDQDLERSQHEHDRAMAERETAAQESSSGAA